MLVKYMVVDCYVDESRQCDVSLDWQVVEKDVQLIVCVGNLVLQLKVSVSIFVL